MERLKNIVLVLFILIFIASLCFNVHHFTAKQGGVYQDTVRTTFVDTIPFYKPAPKDSLVIRYVKERLPVADDKEDNFPNKNHFEDSLELVTNCNRVNEGETDSAEVVIPITQKVYQDSAYTAYVSGYRPQLDSLIFRMPREVVTVREYSKPKRWGIGVQVGYGMSVNGTPQFSPYIGIGVSYNLFSF